MNPFQSPELDPRRDAAANPRAAPTGERLQVEHFVLFAGGVALAAWGERTIYEAILQPSVSLLLGSFGLQILLQVLLQAAGIASLGLLALRRYQRRRTFPAQFGHWLLLLQGGMWLAEQLYWNVHRRIVWDEELVAQGINWELLLSVLFVAIYVVAAVIPTLAAIYSKEQPLWQYCAVALALHTICLAIRPLFGKDLGGMWMSGLLLSGGISVVAFCIAAVRDLIQPAGKDQLHWVGLACHFGLTIGLRAWQLL